MKSLILMFAVLTVGCASTGGKNYGSSKVIERMGGADKTPAWATGATPMFEDKGDVVFAQVTSMSGDTRVEACMRVAAETGRAEILRHIKDNITASGQVSEVSGSGDPAVESLIAFLSQGSLNGARVTERYWEKAEESSNDGERVLRVRCAAKVAIKKQTLMEQMAAATNKGQGNPEIRAKLLEAQKSFIDGLKQD